MTEAFMWAPLILISNEVTQVATDGGVVAAPLPDPVQVGELNSPTEIVSMDPFMDAIRRRSGANSRPFFMPFNEHSVASTS